MDINPGQIILSALVVLFGLILAVQAVMLYKVRRSLSQVSQFMRFVNITFKEMSNIQSQSASMAVNNQRQLKNIRQNSVKTNQKDGCQNCKYRLSFIRIDGGTMEFSYQCKLSGENVVLDYYCKQFEADVEASEKHGLS